jgi:hypothetical protein
MTLTFANLRAVNSTRCLRWHKTGLDEWTVADWVVAAGGEVGEALNVIKKLNRDRDGQPGNTKSRTELRADLADELADIIIYLDIVLSSQEAGDLGTLWDIGSFESLRSHITTTEWPDPAILSTSEWAVGMLEAAGKLATDALTDAPAIGGTADELLLAVDATAWAWGIDLGSAVIRKFNATSERYGFPDRLEVNHG